MKKQLYTYALALAAALGLSAVATAQTEVRAVIGTGATASAAGTTILVGTIGQSIIGPAAAATFVNGQGFWYTIPLVTTPTSVDFSNAGDANAALRCSPNPVSAGASINVRIDRSGPVRLTLFNAVGREVATLIDAPREAGSYTLSFDAAALESGNYIAQLLTNDGAHTIRILVVK